MYTVTEQITIVNVIKAKLNHREHYKGLRDY